MVHPGRAPVMFPSTHMPQLLCDDRWPRAAAGLVSSLRGPGSGGGGVVRLGSGRRRRLRVMVVGGPFERLREVRGLLSAGRSGEFRVRRVRSWARANDLGRARRVDVVLAESPQPGPEAWGAVRGWVEGQPDVPVILWAAQAAAWEGEALAAGVAEVLERGEVTGAWLAHALRRAAGGARAAPRADERRRHLLAEIVQALSAVTGRLDPHGVVVAVEAGNDGCPPFAEGWRGRRLAELWPDATAEIERALSGGRGCFTAGGVDPACGGDWHAEVYLWFDREAGAGALLFARDIGARRQLEQQLVRAVDHEQERLGADLHDGLGQQLTGIACMARALRERIQRVDATAAARAVQVERLAKAALEQARGLSRGLSPVRMVPAALPRALEDLGAQMRGWHGIDVRIEATPGEPGVGEAEAMHLFRIAHEALGNAARHAAARRVRVGLDWGRRELAIEDDGIGFSTTQATGGANLGLRLMEHRAALLGGALTVESTPGGGTRVCCRWGAVNTPAPSLSSL